MIVTVLAAPTRWMPVLAIHALGVELWSIDTAVSDVADLVKAADAGDI